MGSGFVNALTGRRGYIRYTYGTHFWFPTRQTDFSRGMIRDLAKTDIPENGLYSCTDFLVHRPGHLIKRGATVYAGHALGGTATSVTGVFYADFSAGGQLLAVSDPGDNGSSQDGHLYVVTAGAATDKGGVTSHTFKSIDKPKMFFGPAKELVVWAQAEANGAIPIIYDGTNAPHRMDTVSGSGNDGLYCEVYKGRIVVGGGIGNATPVPNRIWFSPVPDPTVAWDTTSFIDCDHSITGFASLQNALLVFSLGHTERLIGSTPPPNSDMDRQPVGDIGCIDARSICIYQNNAVFANARGVYMTNGVGFKSLTAGLHGNDGIETYWQGTVMSGFTHGTDVLSAGIIRDFYIISCSKTGITMMCHIPTMAWTRLSNISANMFASGTATGDELYYADSSSANVVKLSPIFLSENDITDSGKDANGTAVTPSMETRAFGGGLGEIAWGDAHLVAAMNDTSPASTPTLAVQYVPYTYSSEGSATTTSESPFPATAHATFQVDRKRFSVGKDASAMSLKLAQSNASSATVIRALEIDSRGYPQPVEGPNA